MSLASCPYTTTEPNLYPLDSDIGSLTDFTRKARQSLISPQTYVSHHYPDTGFAEILLARCWLNRNQYRILTADLPCPDIPNPNNVAPMLVDYEPLVKLWLDNGLVTEILPNRESLGNLEVMYVRLEPQMCFDTDPCDPITNMIVPDDTIVADDLTPVIRLIQGENVAQEFTSDHNYGLFNVTHTVTRTTFAQLLSTTDPDDEIPLWCLHPVDSYRPVGYSSSVPLTVPARCILSTEQADDDAWLTTIFSYDTQMTERFSYLHHLLCFSYEAALLMFDYHTKNILKDRIASLAHNAEQVQNVVDTFKTVCRRSGAISGPELDRLTTTARGSIANAVRLSKPL